MSGLRGITCLDQDVLTTYPRDEVRGLLLRRKLTLGPAPALEMEVGVDAGRAWEFNLYVDNTLQDKRIIESNGQTGRKWQKLEFDLAGQAGKMVELRLYQRVLVPNRVPGSAYWKNLRLK
jgi:hypothetical protein